MLEEEFRALLSSLANGRLDADFGFSPIESDRAISHWRAAQLRRREWFREGAFMNPIDRELKYPDPQFSYSHGAQTLAVVLHAFLTTRKNMANPIAVVRATYSKEGKGGVDIYAPTLPYKHWWDRTGANRIVVNLVVDLDKIWKGKKSNSEDYANVIFIGHSLGGVILRRVFLAGSLNPPDYSGEKFATLTTCTQTTVSGPRRRPSRNARHLGQGLEHLRARRLVIFARLECSGDYGDACGAFQTRRRALQIRGQV